MKSEELLNHVKAVLRISTNDEGINSEIKMLIKSAIVDLKMSGVKTEKIIDDDITYDEIIVLAISLYCKAKFGFDNPESEKIFESYKSLEQHLALSSEYMERENEI